MLLENGIKLINQGNFQQAAELFLQIIQKDSQHAVAYNCLGVVQHKLHLFTEAENSFQCARNLAPENPDILCNLGALFISMHRLEAAKAYLEEAIQIKPNYSEAYGNLGLIQMEQGLLDEATHSFRCAIQFKPDCAALFNDLGLVQTRQQLWLAAENSFRYAIDLNPAYAEAYNNLGIVLKETRRLEEAAKLIYRAIKLSPHYAEAYNSLGSVLTDLGQNELAERCFCRAIQQQKNYFAPFHNLGVLFTNLNRLDQAEKCFYQAIKRNPSHVQTQFSLATLHLLQGKYEIGWKDYDESRMIKHRRLQPNIPCWNGENLAGKRIALYYEQGFGDTFQFIRYAELVSKTAARTVLYVQVSLQRLITASFPALDVYGVENVKEIPTDHFDFSCPLPSLPRIFHTSSATIPRNTPYIAVEADLILKWNKIIKVQGFNFDYRVGIVWAGNPQHHNDHNRSMALELFSDLLALHQVSWVSLQAGEKSQELAKVSDKILQFSEKMTDFAETAGLIAQLDLVITVDTAVAHLAGAMGKKTWVLLPFAPDWRWQLGREDSPWYPTIRLFRQARSGNWQDVITRVKLALQKELARGNITNKINVACHGS